MRSITGHFWTFLRDKHKSITNECKGPVIIYRGGGAGVLVWEGPYNFVGFRGRVREKNTAFWGRAHKKKNVMGEGPGKK